MKISKVIPLWVKEPIHIYLRESRILPKRIAMRHAVCDFADIKYPGTDKRVSMYMKTHDVIYTYLEKQYKEKIRQTKYEKGVFVDNAPIWMFWWQGEDNCPDTIRLCINSIKKHRGKHPVILITESNFKEYVSLPECILSKQREGIITLTHFSDILRMNLLADHGGYWMDATIFCTKDITEECFEHSIFTCKNPQERYENVSHWRWTGYAIAGHKNNTLFVLAKDIFNDYWKHRNSLIDYFLIDYILRLIYENVPEIKMQLDKLPNNNEHQQYLHTCINDMYTSNNLDMIMSDSTWLYKLTWKANYQKELSGIQTIFGYLLEHME